MHRHSHTQMRIYGLQFFAGQSQGDEVHALAAIAHRKTQPQNAQFSHAFKGKGHGFLLAVILGDDRRNFLLGKIAHHLLHHHVLLR